VHRPKMFMSKYSMHNNDGSGKYAIQPWSTLNSRRCHEIPELAKIDNQYSVLQSLVDGRTSIPHWLGLFPDEAPSEEKNLQTCRLPLPTAPWLAT
jgi:hypothetical protein